MPMTISSRRNNIIRGIISILRVFPDREYILENRAIREKAIRGLVLSETSSRDALKRDWYEVGNYMRKAMGHIAEQEHISLEENIINNIKELEAPHEFLPYKIVF